MEDHIYKRLIEQSPIGYSFYKIIYHDDGNPYDCIFTEVNQSFENITEFKSEDVIGRRITEVFPDSKNEDHGWADYLKSIYHNTGQDEFEYFSQKANKWFKITLCFRENDYFILSFTNITEAERSLKESLTLLREAMHLSKIGSWKWDLKTKHVIWSDEMYQIFGIDKNSVTGRLGDAISRAVHPEDLHVFEDVGAISERKPFEYRIILPDHSIRHILAKTGEVFLDESQKPAYLLGIVQDITEQKEIQKEISYQKELLETVIDNIPYPFSIYDKNGKLVKMNAAGRELYPDPNVTKTIADAHNTYEYFDLDGNRIPTKDLPSRRVLRGERVKNQVIVIRREGVEQITEANAIPIYDSDNIFILFISFHRVITEFVEHQRLIKAQQELLLRTEKDKIEALKESIKIKDEFFSLISHEFKTPITIIDTTIQVMEHTCKNELSDKAIEYLNKIRRNTNRQLRLVNNLLDITRMEAGYINIHKRVIDIICLIRVITESILIFAQHKNIELKFSSGISEKIVCIDDEKIERILLNLLSNAIKFTPEGGSITVRISEKKSKGQDWVCIQVKDKGIGIPEEKQQVVFERFGQVNHSLAREAEGTGIGLHLVKMMVELMGGEITLSSKTGAGSTFTILLPIDKAEGSPIEQITKTDENRLEQLTAIELSDIYM